MFRGHETEPVIPQELAPHLRAVLGLSNFRGAARPHLRAGRRIESGSRVAGSLASGAASPAIFPGTGLGTVSAPADIRSIYGLTLPLAGTGQNVALVELDGYAASDTVNYETQYSSSPTVPRQLRQHRRPGNLCGPNQSDPCDATALAGELSR